MIRITITRNGELLDAITFDAADVKAHEGGKGVVHRNVMQGCAGDSLWHRAAHADRVVATRGNPLNALEIEARDEADFGAALSFLDNVPNLPPDPVDEIERGAGDRTAVSDEDLYHLERHPSETDENYLERCKMLACDERGFIRLPRRRPAECLVPCIICGQPLENESAGNNQPVGGLAFECGGHWPRAVFDAEPGSLEINICEPCLHRAANGRRILHGDHASQRSSAVYKSWQWPKQE